MHFTLQRSWQLYHFRRYNLALEETMKFLSRYPESSEAHCLLALIQGKEKRQDKAITAAEKAIQCSPDWSYPYYVHALVHHWFDKNAAALTSILEALRLKPDDADFFELVATIYAEEGHLRTALQMAEKGLEIDPRHVGCLYYRGVALFHLQHMKEAEQVFRNILSIDAEHGPSQGYVGHFHVLNGHYYEALPLLRNALRDNPDWKTAQIDWKEALRGQYPFYGMMGRLRQWMVKTYRWRIVGFAFLLVSIVLYYFSPEKSRSFPEFLIIPAILGSFITAVILLIVIFFLGCYLTVVSQIIFFLDPELRRSSLWRKLVMQGKSRGNMVYYGIMILLLVTLLAKLFRKN